MAGPLAERMRRAHSRRHPGRSADEISDAFGEAAAQALRTCRKEERDAVYAWMWRAMNSILVDRARQLARETPAPDHANVFELPASAADPQSALEEQENERELHSLFELLVGELAPRQRSVLALHVRGLKRPELARELAVSERIVKRDLEQIMVRARTLLVERCGGGCRENSKLVWRFAFGLASTDEASQARRHLTACPSCHSFLGRLGWWREAAAAAIPAPGVQQADPGLVERTLHKTADVLAHAKQQLADAAGQAKQHAATGYTRAAEYTPIASVRPGAAATAIAGCLALGGGAAGYCIDKGVDPITGLVDVVHPSPAKPAQEPPQQKPPAEQPPDPPQLATPAPAPPEPTPLAPSPEQPAAAPAPAPAPAPAQPAPPPPPPPEPTPPAVQFGEPTNPAAGASMPQSTPAQQEPAPVPEAGGTDLYGP